MKLACLPLLALFLLPACSSSDTGADAGHDVVTPTDTRPIGTDVVPPTDATHDVTTVTDTASDVATVTDTASDVALVTDVALDVVTVTDAGRDVATVTDVPPGSCGTVTCADGQVCVRTLVEGGAIIIPPDGGACPDGWVATGDDSGRPCRRPYSYACAARPAACTAALSCDCARALCSNVCDGASGDELHCLVLAP